METNKIYVYAHYNVYKKGFQVNAQHYEAGESSGDVLLKIVEIQTELPNAETLTAQIVGALRTKKTKILADAHAEAEEVEGVIQTLLVLEHKPQVIPPESDNIPF